MKALMVRDEEREQFISKALGAPKTKANQK